MGLFKEFKEFAMRGNVVDMAVGIVIGAAFGKIVTSLVSDLIMPLVGKITGGADFSSLSYTVQEASKDAQGKEIPAITVNYGSFINSIIDFIIIALAIFMVIKAMNTAKKRFEREKAETPPAAPPEEIQLLREIRDSLTRR
jgi:large conductance mechanosensitive channel